MPGQSDSEHGDGDSGLRSAQQLIEILGTWWGKLGGRQRRILAGRTFAMSPSSLQTLGNELGVSRQRVQQIEEKCLADLQSVASSSPVKGWGIAMRAQINPVVSLATLLGELPALQGVIPTAEIPVWRVLAACDDSYEIREEWCAAPNIAAARAATSGSFRAEDADAGRVDLSTMQARTQELREMASEDVDGWLNACGLAVLEGQVLSITASIPDRAAAVLASEGEPLSAQAIHARLGSDRSIRSLKNALAADERFSRVNREMWGLKLWGLRSYRSIRGLIEVEVDLAGGRVEAAALVTKLTRQFDVKPNSVMAYANAHPFILEEGIVRRRRDEEVNRAARSPWETTRLHRRQRDWALRVRITYDHVRGSGTPIPPALARLLGLAPGGTVALPSEVGDQVFSWSGLGPTIGSVRRLLGDIPEDEEVAFVFGDDGRFAIELLPTPSNPVEAVLSAAALRPQPPNSPFAILAMSIGQSADAQIADTVACLRARGDSDLAELLEGL